MAVSSEIVVPFLLDELVFNENEDSISRYQNPVIKLAVLYAAVSREDVPKVLNYVEVTVPQYLPDDFKTLFRMNRNTFENILQHVSTLDLLQRHVGLGGRPEIPLEKDLLMTLRYLGNLETVRSIADRFNVSKSTFLYHNRRMLTVITDSLLKAVIHWPNNGEKQTVIDSFEDKKSFPGVLGAIDGTHIKIAKPLIRAQDYFNRKGNYSVILQAVCREDRRLTNVYCGWAGKVYDARVVRNSTVFQQLPELTGMNHILGDGAYPISTHLMTPYRDNGHLTGDQINFNRKLSGTQVHIENSFGMLKNRFRRLQCIDMKDMEFIVKTILTGCILNNLCILNADDIDIIFHDEQPENNLANPALPNNVEGVMKRLMITRQLA